MRYRDNINDVFTVEWIFDQYMIIRKDMKPYEDYSDCIILDDMEPIGYYYIKRFNKVYPIYVEAGEYFLTKLNHMNSDRYVILRNLDAIRDYTMSNIKLLKDI